MPSKEERKARELENLKKNSPYALPNNPSQSGWSTGQIKEKFYSGLLYLYSLFDSLRNDNEDKHEGMVVRDKDGSIEVPEEPTSDNDAVSKAYVDEIVREAIKDVYRDKGSVANYSSLPENPQVGDTYNLAETGDNFMWNGYFWDRLSGNLVAGSGVSVNDNTISSLTTATDVVINIKD